MIDARVLDQLDVAFQPIFSLEPFRVVGFEALGRSASGEGPRPLIERALGGGWLLDLDQAWRAKAVAAIAASPFAHAATFFLNFDTRAARDARFDAGAIGALLRGHGLEPARFVLELTEHDPELRAGRTRSLVRRYGAQGFHIALDDLGAGHASLAALVDLEPSIVKLERAVVQGIWRSPIRRRLVEALVGFTRKMGMKLIAEGVDSAADLARLREIGVRYGQGFLLGEPRPLARWCGPELRWCAASPPRGRRRPRPVVSAG